MRCLPLAACLLLAGCASLQHRDPLQVTLAGIEPQKREGLEMRMMVKLRVQNPNDRAIDFKGVALQLGVAGKTLASGVSDARTKVPAYGETVVDVPVTISAFDLVGQAMGIMKSARSGKIDYELKGKLGNGGSSATRFAVDGELELSGVRSILD